MKSMLKAAYNRFGRPSPRRLVLVAGPIAAAALVAIAFLAEARVSQTLSLLMDLAVLGALILVWGQTRRAREESRRSDEVNEVAYRRVLAAIEVERLAAERRHAARAVPGQGGEGER